MGQNVVICGYGAAAVNALIALRAAGYEGGIQVFSDADTLPYSPVMTGYYAGGTKTYEECFPWSEDELAALRAEIHLGEEVLGIDATAHIVSTAKGQYFFDKCLVATGASPVVASYPDGLLESPSLYTLRTLEDAQALKAALEAPECDRVLVMGTSMVGLRAVDAALAQGKEVTLLGRSEHIMRRTALPEMAALMEQHLEEAGVHLRLSQFIEDGEPAGKASELASELAGSAGELADEPAGEAGELARLTFSNGDVEDYSVVVAAQGVVPNADVIDETAQLEGQGLVVDEFQRTVYADVFAAGDVAQVACVQGGNAVAGLWKEACLQGAVAGWAMAAELAGTAPAAAHAYLGFLPNNQIIVAGAVMFSAGSVELNEYRWADIEELESCTLARVFERNVETETTKLVGYNVFAKNAEPLMNDAYEIAAMQYRRLMK